MCNILKEKLQGKKGLRLMQQFTQKLEENNTERRLRVNKRVRLETGGPCQGHEDKLMVNTK